MHFTYLPTVVCPSCGRESEWTELEDSARLLEGTECPRCGSVVPTNQYQLNSKWLCSACNSKVILSDSFNDGDGTYSCSSCGCQGKVITEIGSFEKFTRDGESWYVCPYCNTDLFAPDLIQGSKGQMIICPVCNKIGEI